MNPSFERVATALSHQEPDRVPVYDGFWSEFTAQWRRAHPELDGVDITDHYGVDIAVVAADETPFPTRAGDVESNGDGKTSRDGWGQVKRTVPGGKFYELLDVAVKNKEDLPDIEFDSPALPQRYEPHDERMGTLKQKRFVFCKTGGPYMRTSYLRGPEQFLFDIAEDPTFVKEAVDRLTDHLIQIGLTELERWDLYSSGIAIYDDIAHNGGLMCSPATYEELFYPAMKRMVQAYKNAGARFVLFHSDGDICAVLPLLIEAGVDAFNPVEPRANMNARELRAQYGHRLSVVGGLCNSLVIPQGSREEIAQHVLDLLEVGKGGGLVAGSHSIGPDVPVESYDLVAETLRAYGKYPLQLPTDR